MTMTINDLIRTGHMTNEVNDEKLRQIQKEVLEEICEKCGEKTGDVGPLFARDAKDDKGQHIVQMVCAKCLKSKKRGK